jgi:Sporulation and spore germination
MNRYGSWSRSAAVLLALTIASGCSSLSNDTYSAIDDGQVQKAFAETTTTRAPIFKTTSTTTPPAPTTTTTTTIPTEAVVLYFVTADNKLRAVKRQRPLGYSREGIVNDLRTGPGAAEGAGLRTVVPEATITKVDFATVPPTVELTILVLAAPIDQQALIAGQIAATLTRLPGVGQVRFVVPSLPGEWRPPLPDGTEAERAVTGSDYAPLFA